MSKLSPNAITGVEYEIPSSEVDRQAIENFLAQNNGKQVIVVQGLGFVGAVMSLVCANSLGVEYAVIGVDLLSPATYWRIKSLNEGQFPLIADDPLIEEFYQNARTKGNFLATYDPAAYEYADVIIVDINLDVQKISSEFGVLQDYSVDLSGFKSAMKMIGSHCKEDVLLLVETTVPPGTCQQVVKPLIEEELVKRGLKVDYYKLGHSYERVMPGPQYIDSIRSYPRVYSGIDGKSADAVEVFLSTIIDTSSCTLKRLGSTNATEMAKVLENSYRAMNISFVVEWTKFAEEAGVNLYDVVDAIRARKTHSNLMLPGIGVGGYCLTKDPLLASWANQTFFNSKNSLDMSVGAVATNDRMPFYAFERLKQLHGDLNKVEVLVLGVSYRGDVGDTRFSPVELFVECLESSGAQVFLHDPYVSFWPERNRSVEQNITISLSGEPTVLVITTGHRLYTLNSTVDAIMACKPLTVFDTIGLFSQDQINQLSAKHIVKVLGRGDI